MSVPPDRAEHAREWFSFATGELDVAGRLLEAADEIDLRYRCWPIQQAVEKAIKTPPILEDIEFPWSHDLVELFELLPAEWALRADLIWRRCRFGRPDPVTPDQRRLTNLMRKYSGSSPKPPGS